MTPPTTPTLEIHVPISPTPMFLRQVWALAASLRRFGGRVGAAAPITAWVSPELDGLPDLNARERWAAPLGVTFRWVDPALFAEHWYYGTALARWSAAFTADVVLMLDADTLICRPLDELVAEVLARPALHGLLTHISPLTEPQWSELYAQAGLPAPALECVPLAADFMDFTKSKRMPPYFNLGVLAAPRALMHELGDDLFGEMQRVNAYVELVFRCQIALALAVARQRAPWVGLGLRDNFPNIAGFEQRAPQELAATRIAHYLNKTDTLNKDRDFSSFEAYAALLQRPGLQGLEALVQQRLRELGPCALDGWWQRWKTRRLLARTN